jgi:hypothetical protein
MTQFEWIMLLLIHLTAFAGLSYECMKPRPERGEGG